MSGPLPIDAVSLAIAASLLVVNGLLSLWLGLRLERRLLVAALRTVVQLTLLGYVLVPIFRWKHPGLVLGLAVLMVALASREALRRTSRSYRGAWLSTFSALLVGSALTAGLGATVIIGVDPWWTPRYVIPLVGMILGNALTGVTLGLDRCLDELDEGRTRVEAWLAHGATRWEAARPVAAEALRSGMIPILNSMNVVGLVTIPGMMTGQLLGGTEPDLAARYQILIMFLIAAATATTAGLIVLASLYVLFDDAHRLRAERIRQRG